MNTGRIGVCSWSLRPVGPDALAAALGEIGVPGCQLALGPIVDDPGTWADAISRLRGGGITLLSGMMDMIGEDYTTPQTIARTGGVRPSETWPENRARAERIADAATQAGLPLVTFHAGFIPEDRDDAERAVMLDRIRELGTLFTDRGVQLALETGQETASTLNEMLADLDHPGVGVNFDPANMILYNMGEPVDALRQLAPHVRQIHIKDALPTDTPGDWGTEVPAGTGLVDWAAFFEVVESLPRPVDLVIEREAGADRRDDVRAARDLIVHHRATETSS